MQPDLAFTGPTLEAACTALRPTGCCFRAWAYWMGALASQMCLVDLSVEFLSLPGRCAPPGERLGVRACLHGLAWVWSACMGQGLGLSVERIMPCGGAPACMRHAPSSSLNTQHPLLARPCWFGAASLQPSLFPVSCPMLTCLHPDASASPLPAAEPPCSEDWEDSLLPLLQLPPGCSNITGAALQQQQQQSQARRWLSGELCSGAQLRRSSCPRSSCDLWCGVLGAAEEAGGRPGGF